MHCAFVIFLLVGDAFLVFGKNFEYEGNLGPDHWKEQFPNCTGKYQSPINIEEKDVENVSFPMLELSGVDQPRDAYIENNGHTVMLKVSDPSTIRIAGGPLLNNEYIFEQLHFHWGINDTSGSENMENNHSFAMEIHAVFFNEKYGSISAASNYGDGLVVLAYFVEASEEDDQGAEEIISSLGDVCNHIERSVKLQKKVKLDQILISTKQDYFTYRGSLTTPPCLEIVTWIDFKQPLSLSHEQIAAFRKIHDSHHHKITHNNRPIQQRGTRVIYHNIPRSSIMDKKNHDI